MASLDALIHEAETEAYYHVLRAFRYQSNDISWDKETLITDLRKELNISNDEQIEILATLNKDPKLLCIREFRQRQTGSSNYHHVHDDLHGPTHSPPPKERSIAELLLREDTRLKGVDPGIPYRSRHSGQGRDDDTAGAGRNIRTVDIKFGGIMEFQWPQDAKGKRVSEDITLMDTDMLAKEVERVISVCSPGSLEVKKAEKLLHEQEQALIEAIASLPDDSDDD